jgi:hypothetical protein
LMVEKKIRSKKQETREKTRYQVIIN